jgi:hypothetical protein
LFFFQIFDVAKIGDHPQEDLAKSGYRPYMKVKEFNNALMFLQPNQHTPTHIPIGFKTLKLLNMKELKNCWHQVQIPQIH